MVHKTAHLVLLMSATWTSTLSMAQAGTPPHPGVPSAPSASASKSGVAPVAAKPGAAPGAKSGPVAPTAVPVAASKPGAPTQPATAAAVKPAGDSGKLKIMETSGSVMVNNLPVKVNALVAPTSDFKTGMNARVKVQMADGRTQMVMGADSEVSVKPKGKSLEAEVRSGISRWIVAKAKEANAEQPEIRTRTAIMGIRGTEFFVLATPAFNEMEIVCVDGTVELTDAAIPTDKKMVQKNQWGGIGGRFGNKLAQTLSLNPAQIEIFNKKAPKGK